MKDIRFNISLYIIIPVIFCRHCHIVHHRHLQYDHLLSVQSHESAMARVFVGAAADRIHADLWRPHRKVHDRSGKAICYQNERPGRREK